MKATLPSKPTRHRKVARNSLKHRLWAIEAARQAKQVLPFFERERPDDNRPRQAIEAIAAWGRKKRELGMAAVRKLSLDSHAAARAARTDAARFAARAAGQAVATWHAPTHAIAVPYYFRKAVTASKI